MKELTLIEKNKVSGAKGPGMDPANAQIIKDIGIDAGTGAALTPGSPWIV